MLVTVEGIVIGRRDIGENNVFLDILTADYGVIEVTAHGVKKLTSSNASSTGLFSYADFCLNKSKLKYAVNSAAPKYSFYKLSADLERFSLAVYFAEIVKYTSATEQNDSEMLRFFAKTLYRLENDKISPELIKAVFEFRTCCMLGFMPDLRACSKCAVYEHEKMYFLFDESAIVCGDCAEEGIEREDVFLLSPPLLYALRYVAYSPLEKIYGFSLKGVTAEQFYSFTEKYIENQLGRSFRSLDYYKRIRTTGPN